MSHRTASHCDVPHLYKAFRSHLGHEHVESLESGNFKGDRTCARSSKNVLASVAFAGEACAGEVISSIAGEASVAGEAFAGEVKSPASGAFAGEVITSIAGTCFIRFPSAPRRSLNCCNIRPRSGWHGSCESMVTPARPRKAHHSSTK